jgi:hypothetical protein
MGVTIRTLVGENVAVRCDQGRPIRIFSKTGQIRIPVRPWHALLDANRGREIFFDVYVQGVDRQWRRFRPVANTIAPEDIDGTLVFRFMKPLYTWWKDMVFISATSPTTMSRRFCTAGRLAEGA